MTFFLNSPTLSGSSPALGELPVEVATLFDSIDRRLRATAVSFWRTCTTPSSDEGLLLVRSAPGGGAAEVARYLATIACRARRCRLLSWTAEQPGGLDGQVCLGVFDPGGTLPIQVRGCLFILFSHAREALEPSNEVGLSVLRIPSLSTRPGDALKAALFMAESLLPPGSFFSDDARELIRDYCWPGDLAHMRVTLGLVGQKAFSTNMQVVDADTIRLILNRKERNLIDLCRTYHIGWGIGLRAQDLLHLAAFTGFTRVRQAIELLLIEGAVASGGGNAAVAAKFLGLPYTTLISRQKTLKATHPNPIH